MTAIKENITVPASPRVIRSNTMTDTLQSLRINSDRMLTAFNELAHSRGLGATGDGGVHRPTFSEAHLAARNWYREQIEKAGLEFRTDGAGNHSAVLPASVLTSSQQSLLATLASDAHLPDLLKQWPPGTAARASLTMGRFS
jgi:hypothetical protein